MLQEAAQLPVKVTLLEGGIALFLALYIVEKVIGWVAKLKGNGSKKRCADDPRICAAVQNAEENARVLSTVEKAHEKQTQALDGQTLVLDRIYQGQALQIKALEKLNDKLDSRAR